MSLAPALYARMSGFAGLAALVGDRIYPSEIAQGATLPAVRFEVLAAARPSAMGQDAGIVRSVATCEAWGRTFPEARDVADQLVACWQRFRGTVAGTELLDCFVQDEREVVEAATTPIIYRIAVDIAVFWRG